MTLKNIIEPVKEDLKHFEKEFKQVLRCDIFLIDRVIQYLLRHSGKRLRPALVVLVHRLGSTPEANCSITAAVLVELLHTATLVHDDVIDESDMRRGFPSVNSVWKNKVSVLMGDYLFSRAILSMTDMQNLEVLGVISDAAKRMSQGELLQIERKSDYHMDEAVYFRLISDKTASLISAACQLGAITSKMNGDGRQRMREFGESLGLAFQIRDDLLDVVGTQERTGKPVGADIRENKITLPLLWALKSAPRRDSRRVMRTIKRGPKDAELKEIVSFIEGQGGIEYALQKAEQYGDRAKDQLATFPDSPYKNSLINLVDYVVARNS